MHEVDLITPELLGEPVRQLVASVDVVRCNLAVIDAIFEEVAGVLTPIM